MDVEVEAVPDGRLPQRWSPTGAGEYLNCALKFWFSRVWGWREPTSPALLVGTIVHGVLEELLALQPGERTQSTAMGLLPARLEREFEEEPTAAAQVDRKAAAELAAVSLHAYFLVEDPNTVEVLGLEGEVEATLREVPFYGKIDRLASYDDVLRITDYKTGKASPAHMWDKYRQQYLYVAGLRMLGTIVDEIELLFLGGQARSVRRPVYRAAIDRSLRDFTSAVDGSARDFDRATWSTSPGPLCRFCAFAPACPDKSPRAPRPGTAASSAILVAAGLEQRSRSAGAAPEREPVEDES